MCAVYTYVAININWLLSKINTRPRKIPLIGRFSVAVSPTPAETNPQAAIGKADYVEGMPIFIRARIIDIE